MKRTLSLLLVLCIVLPILPLSALASSTAATVDGGYYDSDYARDVVFGDVPILDWYTGQAGTEYKEKFEDGTLAKMTNYLSYMTTVDTMLGYGDVIVDREDLVEGYCAEIYDQVPLDVKEKMNYSIANGYITREVLGMARESYKKPYNEVQYMYSYTLDPTKEAGYDGPTNLPKLFITSGQQSDEKGAIYGLYYLLQDILYNTSASPVLEYLRNNVILIVVPCLSPGGINQNTYWNANQVNINRNFDYDFQVVMEGFYDANGNPADDGAYNKDGTKADRTQNTGWYAFDQAETCAVRDIIYKNPDIFYYVDFHTFTSGSIKTDQWNKMNWHILPGVGDDYTARLIGAATRMIEKVTKNFMVDYNLASYGCPSDATLGSMSQGVEQGWQKEWVTSVGVMCSVLEGTSGFPTEAQYSQNCQKADSELIGNWLIQMLGEYAYNGNVPTETFTTTFAPNSGNWPTVGNMLIDARGRYDRSQLDAVDANGIYALDPTTYPLTYNGNWTVGYKTIAADGKFDSNPDNFTLFNQVYLYNGSNKPLYITDNKSQWAAHGGLGIANSYNMATAGASGKYISDTTIRYTAEGSGRITIDVSNLVFHSSAFQLVILKNGVEIGSIEATQDTSGYYYDAATGKWSAWNGGTSRARATFATTVEYGDHIDFVSHPIAGDTLNTLLADWNTNKEKIRRGVDDYAFSIAYYKSSASTITASYSGKDDALNSTHPTNANTLLPLLQWFVEGSTTPLKSGADVTGATAKINPALISAGWIKATDTWKEAVEGYKNYVRSLSDVTSVSGWFPGSVEGDGNPFMAGNTFSPIVKKQVFFSDTGACNLFSAKTTEGTAFWPYSLYNGILVSEQYFEAQLSHFCKPADWITVEGTAATLSIPYSAIDGKTMPTVNTGNGAPSHHPDILSTGVCFVHVGDGWAETMLRPHTADEYAGNKIGAIGYTVPNGVFGTATLTVDALYGVEGNGARDNAYNFALFLNGVALIDWTPVDAGSIASGAGKIEINAALKELGSFTVSTGDLIELRFRTAALGTVFRLSPAVTLTIEQEDSYSSYWDGTNGETTMTVPDNFEPLFKWYAAGTDPSKITKNTTAKTSNITDGDFAVVNPVLINYRWISKNDTYAQAIEKYKVYLRQVATMYSKHSDWQIGALVNPDNPYGISLNNRAFDKITNLSFLAYSNMYGIGMSEGGGTSFTYTNNYRSKADQQVWIPDGYFEEMINLYCLEYSYVKVNNAWQQVTFTDGDVDMVDRSSIKVSEFTATTLTYSMLIEQQNALVALGAKGGAPHAWVANGAERYTAMYTAQNQKNAPQYNGVMMRPAGNGAVALAYVVPQGLSGTLKLTLDSLTYGDNGSGTSRKASFKWKLMVDGVDKTGWTVYTPAESAVPHVPSTENLDPINSVLQANQIQVKGGELIEFCVAFNTTNIYVSPAMHVDVMRPGEQALRRVQYASGSKVEMSELVVVGSSIADLIAAYRKTDATFAENGCYVNGVWYEAGAELPEIGMDNIVLDDFKMETAVSVGIGATYKANVYLAALAGASEAGVYIHGKKLPATLQENGTWRVTVSEVYAKEVLDAFVIYTPYYVVDGDEAVCAKYTLIRMKDLLAEYIAGNYATADKALAQAALDYATVAKAYFAKETAPIDVLSRLAACDEVIAADKAATVITAGEKYTFTAASLQIGNTINFVLAIGNKDGSNLTSLDEALTIDGTGISVNEFLPTSIKGQKMMAAVITGVPESKFAESLTFRVADASLVYSVKDYCVRSFASAAEAEKNMIRAVYAIGAAASGEHIHYFGDPTLVYEGGEPIKETVTCLYGNCGDQLTRPIPTLTMEYQDEITLSSPVLEIEKEVVSSTVTGTTTRDANVLLKQDGCAVYATGVGKAYVRTQTGYYIVEVTPAVINMLFLSGQSNAEGARAAEKNDDYASMMKDPSLYDYDDYGRFYKRSPNRMAYYTRTDHSLDITGTGTSTSDYTPDMYVVKTLKWGSEARYSNVVWRGVDVTTLCETEGNLGGVGVCGGLASEWVEQTGERVWVINSSHGGHPIQNFLPIGTEGTLYNPEVPVARYNDYEQAVAVYQLALQTMQNEINAGHFTLNHMVFYWFQGESDNSSTDAYYMECFERLYSELQKDVKLGDKTLDFAGLFTVRSCKDNQGNSLAELQMTATRLADYEMAASQSEIFDNVYCVTNATERWTGEDASVEEYFLDVYGSAENFEAIFGYPMPTKLGQMHPNIHYAIYGQNEMGVDAARNSLMILNDLYGAEYDLSYDDLDATTKVTLVNYDGYTPATEVILSDSKEYGYVIPMVTPLYRMARGVTLSVDPASGFAFDGFRIYVQDGFARKDLADEITVTVRVGDEIAGVYTLGVVFAASTYLDGIKTMVQYGNTQNPPRQEIVIQESVWNYGYVDYTDGSFHELDYYDESNGWYYATGDKLWADYAGSGATFRGAYHSSQGIALANTAGSGFGIAYRVSAAGVIKPYFNAVNANANDMDFAIFVNGVCVWPAVNADYDDHAEWHRISNGNKDGETKTTAEMLNALLADVEIQVQEGDLVTFVFEYVDGRTKSTIEPCVRYAKEEK